MRSYYAVAESLQVALIQCTTYFDKQIWAIVPPERRNVRKDSRPVAILSKSTGSSSLVSVNLENILVDLPGIDKMTHVDNAAMSPKFMASHEISVIVPGDSLNIQIANLGVRPMRLKNCKVNAQEWLLIYFVLFVDRYIEQSAGTNANPVKPRTHRCLVGILSSLRYRQDFETPPGDVEVRGCYRRRGVRIQDFMIKSN